MVEYIKVFPVGSRERKRLEAAAALMEAKSPNGWRYVVRETYFDFGQNWMWTTVICENGSEWGGYQALNPREQEDILMGVEGLEAVVDEVFKDKYCPDRLRVKGVI